MKNRYVPVDPDPPVIWIARFTGYRLQIWGREQVLKAEIEIQIRQEQASFGLWVARAYPGENTPVSIQTSAEACMVFVEALFTTQLDAWQAYTVPGIRPARRMGPTLVVNNRKRAG